MTPPPKNPVAIVLGGGTAGFLTALALRRVMPEGSVRLIHSSAIGIIGVGEGTTVAVTGHLHGGTRLNLDVGDFYRQVHPIWKLGIRYLWGPGKPFNYTFGQLWADPPPLPRPGAYYVDDDLDYVNRASTLMSAGKAFLRDPATGRPVVNHDHAYHLENKLFVGYLQSQAVRAGVTLIDDTVVKVDVGDVGVERLHLATGRVEQGQVYFDCSGFPSELLGKALGEPFVSYKKSLFCDRAVVGGWDRAPDEPIQAYTTAQTMQAGWSWRIDHEHHINRGYVYCPDFITDDEADAEFRRANPKVTSTRIVKFRSGRYERFWVKNVIAIGNASGFVEPLEATAIAAICDQTWSAVAALNNVRRDSPTLRDLLNGRNAGYWDSIARFLAVHYKFNTKLSTPFWQAVRADVDLYGAEPVIDYYRQNGPDTTFGTSLLDPRDPFGPGGYVVMLLGQGVPHENRHLFTSRDTAIYRQWRDHRKHEAARGVTAEEALQAVRRPDWVWQPGFFG